MILAGIPSRVLIDGMVALILSVLPGTSQFTDSASRADLVPRVLGLARSGFCGLGAWGLIGTGRRLADFG